MYLHVLRAVRVGLFACCAISALETSAQAGPVFIIDDAVNGANTYWGGTNPFTGNNVNAKDVVGDTTKFDILSASVTRILTPTGNDLQVVVTSNYIGNIGILSTGLGSLFLGKFDASVNLQTGVPLNSQAPHYNIDTFKNNPGRFDFVVPMLELPGQQTTGNTELRPLLQDGTDVILSHHPGINDTTGPNFRNDQAVGFAGNNLAKARDATWTINALDQTLTFLIKNENNLFGIDFLVAWAMTCSNDIVLGEVLLPNESPPPDPTPLPASFSLFAGGLGLLGYLGSRRRKKHAAKAA